MATKTINKTKDDLAKELRSTKSKLTRMTGKFDKLEADFLKLKEQADANKAKLKKMAEELYEAREKLNVTRGNYEQYKKLYESHELKSQLNTKRSEMVEKDLTMTKSQLALRVEYFEKHPIRAMGKQATFNLLRFIRRTLPLPEAWKLRMARKMTGVAIRLGRPADGAGATALDMSTSANNEIDFEFMPTEKPVISVIVPVYNEISQTIACLKSISQQHVSVDYEVILADDTSPDPFYTILKTVPGLIYNRNPKNLGFLNNCNANAKLARGDYLVFLNNDTLVNPGWLERLYRTFTEHGDVGIAGSKLIFPDGKLQEAGGIIWEDGSGWNWGRGQNPDHPRYNYVRDVDYVSGASLMITRDLWEEIGGFNTELEKAYYEDTDICFKVRSMRKRVVYQPASEVIHIEGLSSGTDVTSGAKKYQEINRGTFRRIWADALGTHLPNATTPEVASDRMAKSHILYIDAVTPEPDKDSGSVDAYYSMKILIGQGHRVHFVPGSNFAHWGEATESLERMGVECIYAPFYTNMNAFLEERGDMFDTVVLARAESCEHYLDIIRKKCPSAKIVFNTVDLHFLRMSREAEISGKAADRKAAEKMQEQELGYIAKSDKIIVISRAERALLSAEHKISLKKIHTIPLIRNESERMGGYEGRQDIAFIGGYKHPPNIDAVHWLVKKVWPAISKAVPDAKLRICGSHMPKEFYEYASDSIIIEGFIPDLEAFLAGLTLTIAPLRFGAGLKGKVASSIGAGVPCVGTDIAFEGMAEKGLKAIKFEANNPETFAKHCASLYLNADKWEKASLSGVTYHNENYAYQNVATLFEKLLK
ncbi:MAG: glycosyltransferase [Hellea sp.]|nr:glycosyltransferase [Hellea sp.]